MKKKLFKTLLLSALMACTIVFPTACSGNAATDEVKIELSDWLYWDTLYINEEYDAAGLVNEKEGVEYSIVNCLYFDEAFERHEIPVTGMTFTQEKPYNVVLEIQAQKGKAIASEVVELDINFRSNEIIDEFIGSWNDDGMAKSLTAKSEYLTGDAKVALAAHYLGNRNPIGNNGMTICCWQTSYNACSVTDWSNAVLSLDVYNPQDYAMKFGLQWYSPEDGDWRFNIDQEIPAESWAHLEWSFRSWGYDLNFFESGGQIYFKTAIKDALDDGTARDYTIYMCNIDIENYDPEKSPDLDTTMPEVVVVPDSNDAKILEKISTTYMDANDNSKIITTRTLDTHFVTGEGTASLKIENSGTFNPSGNNGVGVGMLDGSEYFSVTSWDNVVLTMDVYNASDIDLKFGVQISSKTDVLLYDVTHKLEAGKWTHLDWSLRRIGYFEFSRDSVYFKVGTWEDAVDQQVEYAIYLCNVDVTDYSAKKFPDLETRTDEEIADEEWAAIPGDDLDKKVALYTKRDGNYTAEVDTTEHCDQLKGSESSVKFTFTQDPSKGNPNVNRGAFIYDDTGVLFDEFEVTDWSDVYLGFWVKPGDLSKLSGWCPLTIQVYFATTIDGVTYVGSQYFNFQGYNGPVNVTKVDEWTYVEFSLKDLGIATGAVTNFKFSLCNESVLAADGDKMTFYIDGLDIYTGSKVTHGNQD